jgi:hypothetical protein
VGVGCQRATSKFRRLAEHDTNEEIEAVAFIFHAKRICTREAPEVSAAWEAEVPEVA